VNTEQELKVIRAANSSIIDPGSAQVLAAMALKTTSSASDIYIRIGRRTLDDVDGDIPTEYLVFARINAKKQRVDWLSVATWQFNGLRIGALEAGDRVREDDDSFSRTTGVDLDPYFFALNLLSLERIREHLLELVARKSLRTEPETYDADVAQIERNQAQWARMVQEYGPQIADTQGMRAVAGQDPKQRFPHPWALPAVLTDSSDTSFIGVKPGPNKACQRRAKQEWLPTFDSLGKGTRISSINVMAVFINDFDDRSLRLKHFIEPDFEADESVKSAKQYFLEGDEAEDSNFCGLNNNSYLSRLEWSLELWVLPQVEGCTTLIKWNDVPQLRAQDLCDWRAIQKGQGKREM
jgi:hypothetical protein